MTTMRAILVRVPQQALIGLGIAAAIAIAISVWRLQSGTAAPESVPEAEAFRDDIVVSVGGVGRIVQARSFGEIAVSTAGGGAAGSAGGGGAGSAAGGSSSVSPDAVFPRAAGRLLTFLVAPGERVAAGQALAVLDDGGAAASATKQAQNRLTSELLELRRKQTSDPQRGRPPTQAELTAVRLAIKAARLRLSQLLGPQYRADLSAARLDLKRAKADLETLLGGSPAARAEAIRLAEKNVQLTQERLDQLLAPPSAADVNAAEAELKRAEADLAVLRKAQQPPLAEALAAAQQAVVVARLNLEKVQGSPDPAQVAAAQLELNKALAELAGLQRPAQGPLPEEIAAAEKIIEAARAKLAKLIGPPNPPDVTAARLDLERAQADLRTLQAGPTPAGRAAAGEAVAAARARLQQVLQPGRLDVVLARLELAKANAAMAVLRTRGGPGSPIDIRLARLKVKSAQARVDSARSAQRLLTVRAPSDGTVTALLSAQGAPVDASTPIVTLADLAHLAVSVDLSEFDAAKVKRGQRTVVKVDALGGKAFPGKVVFAALTGTDNGGVVTFPVRVGLERAAGLKPGMNVSVRIIVAQRADAVQVPLEAVSHDDENRPILTVIDGSGATSERRVKLGLANNKNVEIVSGLRVGERVELAESQAGQGGEE
jgi:RND family efflux transporter MFP subunit